MGSPASHRIARVRCYSSTNPGAAYVSPTRLSRSTATLSRRLRMIERKQSGAAAPAEPSSNPHAARPAGLAQRGFGLLPVRSPLLREYFLFLGVHEMFQFPRCPPSVRTVTTKRSLGCPIRRSWDHGLLTAPPRLSQLCHVLHRHAAPRHPPSAPSVFPTGRPEKLAGLTRSLVCRTWLCQAQRFSLALHFLRYHPAPAADRLKSGLLQALSGAFTPESC